MGTQLSIKEIMENKLWIDSKYKLNGKIVSKEDCINTSHKFFNQPYTKSRTKKVVKKAKEVSALINEEIKFFIGNKFKEAVNKALGTYEDEILKEKDINLVRQKISSSIEGVQISNNILKKSLNDNLPTLFGTLDKTFQELVSENTKNEEQLEKLKKEADKNNSLSKSEIEKLESKCEESKFYIKQAKSILESQDKFTQQFSKCLTECKANSKKLKGLALNSNLSILSQKTMRNHLIRMNNILRKVLKDMNDLMNSLEGEYDKNSMKEKLDEIYAILKSSASNKDSYHWNQNIIMRASTGMEQQMSESRKAELMDIVVLKAKKYTQELYKIANLNTLNKSFLKKGFDFAKKVLTIMNILKTNEQKLEKKKQETVNKVAVKGFNREEAGLLFDCTCLSTRTMLTSARHSELINQMKSIAGGNFEIADIQDPTIRIIKHVAICIGIVLAVLTVLTFISALFVEAMPTVMTTIAGIATDIASYGSKSSTAVKVTKAVVTAATTVV